MSYLKLLLRKNLLTFGIAYYPISVTNFVTNCKDRKLVTSYLVQERCKVNHSTESSRSITFVNWSEMRSRKLDLTVLFAVVVVVLIHYIYYTFLSPRKSNSIQFCQPFQGHATWFAVFQ